MKKLLLAFTLSLSFVTVFGQLTAVDWSTGYGGNNLDSRHMAYDSQHNIYITGAFKDTVDFDPSVGVNQLISNGLQDAYLAKYDQNGQLLWVKQFGSINTDIGYSIVITHTDEVLLSGVFYDTLDFDPGPGVHEFAPNDDGSSSTGFILKLDQNGSFISVKKMGGNIKISLDPFDNVLVFCNFSGTKDFDPDPATVYNLTAVTSAFGTFDLAVAKLDQNFNFLWAFAYGSYLNENILFAKTDSIGNVYLAGSFFSTVDFDPSAATFNMQASRQGSMTNFQDVFLAKYDPNGNFIWAKQIGNQAHDFPLTMEMDSDANIYITGQYENALSGPVDFDPNAGTYLLDAAVGHYFHAKYNANGELIWANCVHAVPRQMVLTKSRNIYLGGQFGNAASSGDSVDMDPGINQNYLVTTTGQDGYLSMLDQDGNFQFAKRIGGSINENVNVMLLDDQENLYVSGLYKWSSSTFLDDPNPMQLTYEGATKDLFLIKLMESKGILGKVFLDNNATCSLDSAETGLDSIQLTIQPGNIQVVTDVSGVWFLDSLPVGNYTVSFSPDCNYVSNCSTTQNFSVVNTDSLIYAPSFALVPNPLNFSTISVNSCTSYTAPDGQVYNTSGTYTAIIPGSMGCDSTITINLSIVPPTTSTISETACSSYTAPDGQVYTSSGTYTATIANAMGCDSVITINLTINNLNSSASISPTSCSSYTAPDGQVYTASGTYTAIVPNAMGCDSVITINLTVNQPSASNISESVCTSYTAPDGQVYTSSGTYTAIVPNASGCDSVITINLTVNQPSASNISETVCLTYTAADGQVYTSSGTYTAIISNAAGCDSVITINLTVNQPSASNIMETVCSTYTAPDGQIYTSSGTYTAIVSNALGCDSVITINLTIGNIDLSVSVNSPDLHANADNAAYQWLDCNANFSPLAFQTAQDFSAEFNGSYAVEITQGACVDTSDCVTISGIGLDEIKTEFTSLYPNPSEGSFKIEFAQLEADVQISIVDVLGREVYRSALNNAQKIEVTLDQSPGVYEVFVTSANKGTDKHRLIIY